MDTPDRLAAYLADELDPADRAALDDELASDGQLRAELAAMRRADDALHGLSTPEPTEGFDDRMEAFVDELLAELDVVTTSTSAAGTTDESLATTPDTNRSGWVLAVAAGLVLLVGVGVATLQPFGGDDDAVGSGAELSSLGDQEASDDMAADTEEAADGQGILALPVQPTIVDEQRSLDDDQLDALLTEPALTEVAAARLDRDTGTDVGLQLQRQLGQDGDATGPDTDAGPSIESSEDADVGGGEPLFTRSGDAVDEDLLADAQRCLGTLLEAGPTAIPVYLELATVASQPALVFGLVTIDPEDDGFTRREIWTLERSTCQVLRFAQR